MWKRRAVDLMHTKKERIGQQPLVAVAAQPVAAPAGQTAPFGRASATLRKIRIRRRIVAAATAVAASATAAAASATAAAASAPALAAPNASVLTNPEREVIRRRQLSHCRTLALQPIAEEAVATSARSRSGASRSRNSDTADAVCSSYSSAELRELNTDEVFADKTATSSTEVSSSVQATAGSSVTSTGSSIEQSSALCVRLEKFSVVPLTPTSSGELTMPQCCGGSSNAQLSSSGRSFSVSVNEGGGTCGLAGNFLLEDPVIRGFLGDSDFSGTDSRSCASISFAIPTRDTGEVVEAAATESASHIPAGETRIRTAEDRDWRSGESFASRNAFWGSSSDAPITPLKSTGPIATASVNLTAGTVESVMRRQLLTPLTSTTEALNSSVESSPADRQHDLPSRQQLSARHTIDLASFSEPHSSHRQQQQMQQNRLQGRSSQQRSSSEAESDLALILEVTRGGQASAFSSNCLNMSSTENAAALQPTESDTSDSTEPVEQRPALQASGNPVGVQTSQTLISQAPPAAAPLSSGGGSGAGAAEATAKQQYDYKVDDVSRMQADWRQTQRPSDPVAAAAASLFPERCESAKPIAAEKL